ncbi:MAG: DUF1080 domain-containing protein [Planctomycetota bacterium]|nr:MAG: DUF1080 domain-containing protein [Planctomycetota bacterium]
MFNSFSRWLVCILAVTFAVPVAIAARKKGPAPPPRTDKIRVLIVTGGHGFDRDEFAKIFDGHPDIDWKEVQHPNAAEWFAPPKADQYDVMVWYDMLTKTTEKLRNNLPTLMKKGKPLVALHHCLANFQDWDEVINILGGRYNIKAKDGSSKSSAHHNLKVSVKIADPKHPITKFIKDFDTIDETYLDYEILPGVKPLLTTDNPKSNKVIGWTHKYGNSPVVYIQLGHGPQTYQNPSYRRVVVQAIRWAAGKLPDPSEEGFVTIFNGKNLDGWKPVGNVKGFEVTEAGAIRSVFGRGYGWLRYDKKQFSDFILRLEWKVSKRGNSGVFIRAAESNIPWVEGSEIQISNRPRDIAHCTGSVYGVAAVDPRPDESAEVWHEFEIQCNGPKVKVFADNIPIVDVDGWSLPALGIKPLKGYIGLQDAHEPGWIEFRNVRIKELPAYKLEKPIWRLSMMAYTFRKFTLYEAIEKTKALGLRHLEAYPWQKLSPENPNVNVDYQMPRELKNELKAKLSGAGIKLINYYGLVKVGNNPARIRKEFKFAKEMGIETIVAEPDAKVFDLLEKLAEEFGINIAIHNHPRKLGDPSYTYWDPSEVMKLIGNRSKRLGFCADTGHWVRSGLDPVEALKTCKGRVLTLHLKDLNKKSPKAHDVPWGTGVTDVEAVMKELRNQEFSGVFSLEYEHNPENPMPDVKKCIKYFNKVAESMDVINF